jgi:hypothetical protein
MFLKPGHLALPPGRISGDRHEEGEKGKIYHNDRNIFPLL